jgi:hypothetical protein
MAAYVGPIGALVKVRTPTRVRPTVARPASARVTLGGRRKVHLGARALRGQHVALPYSSPGDVANLAALVAGEYGPGPFWWVDPWAQVTNLYTPAASTLDAGTWATANGPAAAGGAVQLDDGVLAGRSIVPSGSGVTVYLGRRLGVRDDTPVLPGVPVTASVWVSGDSVTVRAQFVDAAGALLTSATTTYSAGGTPRRVSVTGTPPATATAVYVAVTGATRIARPALTWTSGVRPWHVGQGMPRVAITALDSDVVTAWDGAHGQGLTAAFTVLEVG